MPTYRNVIAGLAISTALAGGVVGLSTVTSATAASATTIHTSLGSCDHSGWGHNRRACRSRWGGHHNRFRSEQRFRQTVKKFATSVRNCDSDGDVIIDIDSDD